MKKQSLGILIQPGPAGIIIPLLIGAAFWLIGFFISPEPEWSAPKVTPLAEWFNTFIPVHSILSHSLGFIFTILIGLLLVQFNETFSFIRTRTLLPFFFFILLMGSNINMHEFSFGQISCFFLLLALWQLFSIYQQNNPVKQTFNIGFFLALGVFFSLELIFFLPVFWLGMIRLNSFRFRTFLSSIIGFLCPFILFLGVAYLQSDVMSYINLFINQFDFELNFFNYNFIFILYVGTLTLCALFAIINLVNKSFSDNIKVSRMLGVISLNFIFCILLFLFFSYKSTLIFTFTALFGSILYAHYFSLHYNLFLRVLFWILIAINLLFFMYSVFFS